MQNKIFDRKKIEFILILFVVLMVIGSLFDYQISSAVFNEQSLFGSIFAAFGEVPAFLCLCTAGILLIKIADRKHMVSFVLSWIFGILLNVLTFLSAMVMPAHYMNLSKGAGVIIAVILVGGLDILVWRMSQGAEREIVKKVILLFVLVPVLEIMIINIIKIPWGRPRMRMIAVEPEAAFQSWWIIGSDMKEKLMALGVAGEEFKSFPSGHTGNAACALLLSVFPMFCAKLRGKENLLFGIGLAFALIVAFSRIVMGAHFLTDTSVGLMVTFLVIIALYKGIFRKENGLK